MFAGRCLLLVGCALAVYGRVCVFVCLCLVLAGR